MNWDQMTLQEKQEHYERQNHWLDIKPMSFGYEQRLQATRLAGILGRGVRMDVGSGATRFYADERVPAGHIEVWRPLEYKGQLVLWGTLTSPEQEWSPEMQEPSSSPIGDVSS